MQRWLDRHYKRTVWIGVPLGLLLLALGSSSVYAQSGTSRTDLTLYPSKTVLTLAPGEVWQGELRIAVTSSDTTSVASQTADFRSDANEGGVPVFYQAEPDQEVGVLSRWMTLGVDQLELSPNTFGTVSVRIVVPANASPGGHYGAVLMQPARATLSLDTSNAAIDQFIAALFIVNVTGRTLDQGKLADFYFSHDVYAQLPAVAVIRFKNDGNTHIAPQGVVEIFNELGVLVAKQPVNAEAGLVLPASTRRFSISWGEPWIEAPWPSFSLGKPLAMGLYRAKLTLWYGALGQVVERETTFVVLPWLPLALIFLTVLLSARLISWLLRRYQLWVLVARLN